MKKIVALTGAGISAESGIPTFRDFGGLWEGFDIGEVASPEGWRKNPSKVLEFYNQRRKKAYEVRPNPGHIFLAKLENHFDVTIVTQNIDNLHEQAGSSRVIHLHGNIFEARSTLDPNLVYPLKSWELKVGDKCEKGSQLRPNIVWFGEMVPKMEEAIRLTSKAEIFIIAGTSLVVYPAAALLDYAPPNIPVFVVDPKIPELRAGEKMQIYREKASTGIPKVFQKLVKEFVSNDLKPPTLN